MTTLYPCWIAVVQTNEDPEILKISYSTSLDKNNKPIRPTKAAVFKDLANIRPGQTPKYIELFESKWVHVEIK